MKKIISFVLILSLSLTCFGTFSFAQDEELVTQSVFTGENLEDFEFMKSLGVNTNPGCDQTFVTRGDFVLSVINLLGFTAGFGNGETSFIDVAKDTPYANALEYALILNIVSKSESFFPERSITYDEAIKIMVCALGYGEEAKYKGGYPVGYKTIANSLDLLDDLKSSQGEFVTGYDFYKMLKNMACADTQYVYSVNVGDKSISFDRKKINLLKAYHDIYYFEGIVEANELSHLYDGEYTAPDGFILVDSNMYIADMNKYPLGYYIEGYYKQITPSKRSIVYADTSKNKVIALDKDARFSSDYKYIEYIDDNSKTRKYKLSDIYAMIYNYKSYISSDIPDLSKNKVTLLDNDEDGVYEVIDFKSPNYIEVLDYNDYYSIIYDANAMDSIKLYDDTKYRFSNGSASVDLDEIKIGGFYEYYMSEDKKFINAINITNSVTGVYDGIDMENKTAYIGDTKYEFTSYFEKVSMPKLKKGERVNVILSTDGKLVFGKSENAKGYPYGYLYDVGKTNALNPEVKIKIFTQDGNHEIYTLSEKLKYDLSKKTDEEVYDIILPKGEFLIRYHLDKDGAVDEIVTEDASYENDEYKLERYRYKGYDTKAEITYRNTGIFYPYFVADNSSLRFVITDDYTLPFEERFNIASSLTFVRSNTKFEAEDILAYNIEDGGYAPVVVVKRQPAKMKVEEASSFAVVSDASIALDPDGNISIKLELYYSNSYKFYYVDLKSSFLDNIRPESETHFQKGDVIRYEANNKDYIIDAALDFDGENRKLIHVNDGDVDTLTYYYGKLYSIGTKSICIFEGDIENQKSMIWSNALIDRVTDTNDVYCVSRSELVGYDKVGDDCQNVLVKVGDTQVRAVIIYD